MSMARRSTALHVAVLTNLHVAVLTNLSWKSTAQRSMALPVGSLRHESAFAPRAVCLAMSSVWWPARAPRRPICSSAWRAARAPRRPICSSVWRPARSPRRPICSSAWRPARSPRRPICSNPAAVDGWSWDCRGHQARRVPLLYHHCRVYAVYTAFGQWARPIYSKAAAGRWGVCTRICTRLLIEPRATTERSIG